MQSQWAQAAPPPPAAAGSSSSSTSSALLDTSIWLDDNGNLYNYSDFDPTLLNLSDNDLSDLAAFGSGFGLFPAQEQSSANDGSTFLNVRQSCAVDQPGDYAIPTFSSSTPLQSCSTSPSALDRDVGSSASVSTSGTQLSSTPALDSSAGEATASRKRKRDRERNTEAARRYRQRRLDEVDDLKAELAAMTKERDEMKLKLVKAETEADLLRRMVGRG